MATMKLVMVVRQIAKFGIPSIHAFVLPTTTTSSPSTLTARRHLRVKLSHRVSGLTCA